VRIKLDAAGYRAKREQALTALATRVANKAVKTRRSKTLEPMNPYERRIIHTAVQEVEGAKSWSVGEEPNRCVVIGSENGRPPREGEEKPRSRGSNRGRRDDRRREPRDDSKYAHRNDLYTKKPRPVVPFKERTQSNIELKAADTPLYSRLDKDDDFDY
jgi:spoIIIJ-associated protein